MRAQIPHMNDGGSIVNASRIAGLQGFKQNAAYVASKSVNPASQNVVSILTRCTRHAVIGLTRSAAKELGERNIRCNCFAP